MWPAPATWWRATATICSTTRWSVFWSRSARPAEPTSATASGSQCLAPWQIAIATPVGGQCQDALTQDVAHDLRRAALDRVRSHAQEGLLRAAAVATRDLRANPGVAARFQHAVGSEQAHAERGHFL